MIASILDTDEFRSQVCVVTGAARGIGAAIAPPSPEENLSGFRSVDALVARSPMHRLATVAEIADAIDFLASTAAAYVTGSVLDVDGGWNTYSWFYPARDL